MDPDRIVRDFSAAWGRADLDAIMDAFAEDAVYHNIPMEPCEGKGAIKGFIEGFFTTSPGGIDFNILNQAAAGRVVINERVDTFESEGKKTPIQVCGVFELDEDGKIKAWRDYFDMGAFQGS
ncbi:MAG: limonene-1,2-epoxide hydrolase [Deltaproteobacteria bacterium]|nr:limonene-1,2-epoxide hydrolase [Deltaproteobacteria bacterium]